MGFSRYSGFFPQGIIWEFCGVVVRPLTFHLQGSEFDPQQGGYEPSHYVKRV